MYCYYIGSSLCVEGLKSMVLEIAPREMKVNKPYDEQGEGNLKIQEDDVITILDGW